MANKKALPTAREMNSELLDYRKSLQAIEQQSQESFDKTLVSLSGGALGVSFAFVQQFLGEGVSVAPRLLWASWLLWVLAVTLVLVSHYISVLANRRAVEDLDAGREFECPGGAFDRALVILNPTAGVALIAGLVTAGLFIMKNL